MKFLLEIEVGNEAMQTWADLSNAVHLVAGEITFDGDLDTLATAVDVTNGTLIRDLNGNKIGELEVTA